MSRKLSVKLFSAVIVTMLLAAMQLFAQSTVTGGISGTVTDPQGALVPNASVTATNIGTNASTTVTTNDDGGFKFSNLQPGTYRVETAAISGFSAAKAESVIVEVGQVTPIDFKLAVGGQTATVTVNAEAPVINVTDNSNTTNINQTSINELPINGRRAASFVLATPGVVPDGGFGLFSFRGVSGLLNNQTVDGGDDNQAFFSEARGRTRISYSISLDAVREFSVNTSNYSAEFGRAAGGVVNTVTKSGTNEFHGSAFYYLRDNKWGARNPVSFRTISTPTGNQVVPVKPLDRRHQFGGSIGGPIVKDKLFFFFSYDEQRRLFPGVAAPASPTFFNPITVAGLTAAQVQSGLDYLRSLTGEVARRGDQRLFLPKIDWVINENNTFSAVYNRMRWKSPAGVQTAAVVFRGTTGWGNDFVELDSLNLRLNSTLRSNVINEARVQLSKDLEVQAAQAPNSNEPTTANGFPPQTTIISSSAGFVIGKPDFLDRAAYPDERRFQVADTVSWNKGRHGVKFGGDINRVKDKLDNLFQNAGAYVYSTLADFLTDYAIPASKKYSSFNQGFGPTAFTFRTTDYNAFVQDNFQIHPRLAINLGLRYEFEKLPTPQIPNPLEPRTSVFPSDKNNFGPRVGLAFDVFGDSKTSIRGGYGLYFGRIINSTISNAITNTGTTGSQKQYQLLNNTAGSPTYPNVLSAPPAIAGVAPDIVVFSPKFQAPEIHQMDVVFEHMIGQNMSFSVSGIFSEGRKLPTFVDTNLGVPNTITTYTFVNGPFNGQFLNLPRYGGTRPNTNFGRITEIRSTIWSSYQALVLQLNRRLTDGIQFQTSYTFSQARDNNQISQTFTSGNVPLDPNNLSYEPGVSNFDIPHRFVASAVYAPKTLFGLGSGSRAGRAILGGWSIAPILTISSGTPYSYNVSGNAPTPRISTGIFGAGGANRLPNVARNSLRTPHITNVDLRVSRRFTLHEGVGLEILGEAFNLFNRFQVTGVNTTAYTISGTNLNYQGATSTSPFGVANSAGNSILRERQIQFAARLHF